MHLSIRRVSHKVTHTHLYGDTGGKELKNDFELFSDPLLLSDAFFRRGGVGLLNDFESNFRGAPSKN